MSLRVTETHSLDSQNANELQEVNNSADEIEDYGESYDSQNSETMYAKL